MVKVVKFGGSSLASAEQFKKVGNIIRAEESRRYVVPSAPGKRFSEDTKVTDMLYKCYAEAEEGKNFDKSLKAIKERYNEIIKGLGLKLSLEEQFETIKKQFAAKAGKDYAASRGEYLNGIIMANYLGYEFIDAATVICFVKMVNLNLKNQSGDERTSCKYRKCRYSGLLRCNAKRSGKDIFKRRFRCNRFYRGKSFKGRCI